MDASIQAWAGLKGWRCKIMKWRLMVAAIFLVLFFSGPLYAGDIGPYIGVGGSYAWEDFDTISADTTPINLDDTWGFNARAGYQFSRFLALEFEFAYLSDFDWNGTVMVSGAPVGTKVEVDVETYMFVGKFFADFGSRIVKPYLAAGIGWMHSSPDLTASAGGVALTSDISDTDACVKAGIGADFYVSRDISIGLEADYVWGLGELDELQYTNLLLGVAYHF